MFSVIVISKDQPEYIKDFERALDGYNHLYVIDRPTKDYPAGIPAIVNRYGEGFLAGRMRDIGALFFPGDDILFLDGDKVPKGNLSALDAMPYDCVLLGTEKDKRKFFDGTTHEVKVPVDFDAQWNGVYSCGILIRKNLIKRLREVNDGRIFNFVFDGCWGEEDTWNGDVIFREGWKVGCTSEVVLSGRVDGIDTDDSTKMDGLCTNFFKRLELRKKVFGS